ncbi:MAG: hypothetical protein GY768_15530 [Planctomycetaceae bacterium]|nr:hypothetical protein [Planctomycetaceae bacterium]
MHDLPAFNHGLRLSSIIPQGKWHGGDETRVTSCCVAPDQCQPGDLFVVMDDTHIESQEAIELAVERGATAILTERIIPCSLPQFIVNDTRIAFGSLCHALSGNPCQSLRTIGITGSYGKSMTQQLLMGIFSQANIKAGSMNSYGPIGNQRSATELHTQPNPATMANWLAQSRSQGATHAVMEVSSRSLATRQFSGMSLDAAVITNIRREHVEWHGSLRNYHLAKARLLKHLKPGGFAVLNADDAVSCSLLATLDIPALTIGLHKPAELSATLIERHPSEQTFLLDAGDESIAIRTQIIGDAHIYNCLTAAAVALTLGIDPNKVVRGIESIESVPCALQRIECGQAFGAFVDASYTAESLGNVLQTLEEVTAGRLHCVLGVDHRVSTAGRARTGQILEKFADATVLTSSRFDRKMSLNTAHDVLDGFDRPSQGHLMPDRAKAICWALAEAEPGDTVVLAGGRESMGPDQVTLCDEDVTRYWLQHVDENYSCPWSPA